MAEQNRVSRYVLNERYLNAHMKDILNMKSAKNLNELIDNISFYTKDKGKGISSSQLRNIFTKVKGAKKVELQLLRPKLAYIAARQKAGNGKRDEKELAEKFITFIDKIIQQIENEEEAKGFSQFFESIVAYHKFHHPKN